MAITQTGAMYKSLSFDNTSSRSYGVYITGEAVYNAPERAVEMISIPGRNGAFALDQGRFENIEVSYPAGIFAENEADFAQAVSDFRNFLCSKKGYCRLTDEYNPNEYRMAVYKSGLEVDPAQLRAGEFTITFDCKPQRFLTSGETATTVANNGTMTNPTLFDASPLLEVTGYGTVGFNGYEIELTNATAGQVELLSNYKSPSGGSANDTAVFTATLNNTGLLNTGDTITLNNVAIEYKPARKGGQYIAFSSVTLNSYSGFSSCNAFISSNNFYVNATFNQLSFVYGTASTSTTGQASVTIEASTTRTLTLSLSYDGNSTITITATGSGVSGYYSIAKTVSIDSVYGTSTKTLLGNPTYIDCDLGEAYRIDNNVATSLNAYIDLGSDLPKLAPGSNTFTKSNTITQLKVTPRWWRV